VEGKWKGRVLAGDDPISTGGNDSIVGVEDYVRIPGESRFPQDVWVATKAVLMRTDLLTTVSKAVRVTQ